MSFDSEGVAAGKIGWVCSFLDSGPGVKLELVSERFDLDFESLMHRSAFLAFGADGGGRLPRFLLKCPQ